MRLWAVALLLLGAVSGSRPLDGQAKRFPVFVSHSGEDAVGEALAYAVREELRRSAGYELGSSKLALFTIGLVSLDAEVRGNDKGIWSACAVTYTMTNLLPLDTSNPQTWYPIHLSTTIRTVGRERVDAVATSIVAELDTEVQQFLVAGNK